MRVDPKKQKERNGLRLWDGESPTATLTAQTKIKNPNGAKHV
jgi:hypothetical protein